MNQNNGDKNANGNNEIDGNEATTHDTNVLTETTQAVHALWFVDTAAINGVDTFTGFTQWKRIIARCY